ncbi:aldose epimerase family protein [Pseudoduganella umbonata]|uniref:Aldose 1-epimerase n=1 Tax=Pseudoduganella umbonata TaxID=864828 RepID=A0A4P8HS12_9BURK|nr:aldose epimerase family protein [Pseudoduganella umbonata]MBB3220505.1 aldose 1-epimerase [Pseudoduganella umbonata]QCP11976.1 galactose mutarotase [Pseudoduganella umbonata]
MIRPSIATAALALVLAGAAADGGCTDTHQGILVRPFGVLAGGQAIEQVTLTNTRGMTLSYIDYGATITGAAVPDRSGRRANVILDLPDLATYERSKSKHAAVIGRFAGRIANARYTLDGKTVELIPNARGMTIHGGPDGYEKRVWKRRDFADGASIGSVYTLVSPDGDQRFPGTLTIDVTYRLQRASDEFSIEYAARTDKPTVLNLTNHGYFNLAGAGSGGLQTHRFCIAAERYAVTDEQRLPSGELAPVAGTPLDLRRPTDIAPLLAQPKGTLAAPRGFDHSYVFGQPAGTLARAAVIDETASGRRLEILTTEPSAQFYTGNGFNGTERGSSGRPYQQYDGFAFETQHLPDSPNQPSFPTTALYPGQEFRSVTTFRFSAVPQGAAPATCMPASAGR